MTLKLAKPTTAKLAFRKTWQPMDADAAAYITAVETADGQALEEKTKIAIDNFVLGCKADGIWSAFEQCGILCAARTRQGAVIPLVKPVGNADPTFAGTVGGWTYARKIGLNGNGTDNYVDTKYIIPVGNQNNIHIAIWKTTTAGGGGNPYHIGATTASFAVASSIGGNGMYSNSAAFFANTDSQPNAIGLHVHTRIASGSINYKRPGFGITTVGINSSTPPTVSSYLFNVNNNGTPGGTQWSSAPLGFYSIGKNLSIDTLNFRVTDLINAIGAAIP